MKKFTPLAAAILLASSAAYAENEAGITQDGLNNTSTIVQTEVSAASATVSVIGDANRTALRQDGGSDNVTATVTVTSGNDNVINVAQSNSQNVSTDVQVNGSSNNTVITQNNVIGTKDGAEKTARVTINGSGSINADIAQENVTNVTATIDQSGGTVKHGNSATIVQNGNGSGLEASIRQSVSGGNTATIKQLDNTRNSVTSIDQAGADNTAVITQNHTNGSDQDVKITVTGNDNSATISQTNVSGLKGSVEINIKDSGGKAEIFQDNVSAVEARITQNSDSAGVGNTAKIVQNGGGTNLTATIDQSNGDGNAATIKQIENTVNSTASIEQIGGGNIAAIVQKKASNGFYTQGSEARISSTGEGNTARIEQLHTKPGTVARITQVGDANTGTIRQEGLLRNKYTANIWQQDNSTNTVAAIEQFSNDHGYGEATITQSNSHGTKASIRQKNTRGTVSATITQTNLNNSGGFQSLIDQSGTDLTASITSRDGDSSDAMINQRGEGHNATVTQEGNNSYAKITQSGSSHTATVEQGGSDHIASINQSGSNHIARIEQRGSDNSAVITQSGYGTGNEGVINQSGNHNNATITQSGEGLSYTISQTGDFAMLNVIQTGTDNSADLDLGGQDNHAQMTQTATTGNSDVVLKQDGHDNWASASQDGTALEVTIEQMAGEYNKATIKQVGSSMSAKVVQSGTGLSGESMNIAMIDQTSTGAVAAITQSGGAGNSATINQY